MFADKDSQLLMVKGGAAWSGVGLSKYLTSIGINDWGDAAALMAFLYSCILIGEWVYKKLKQ